MYPKSNLIELKTLTVTCWHFKCARCIHKLVNTKHNKRETQNNTGRVWPKDVELETKDNGESEAEQAINIRQEMDEAEKALDAEELARKEEEVMNKRKGN